jgi:hypothetical protein
MAIAASIERDGPSSVTMMRFIYGRRPRRDRGGRLNAAVAAATASSGRNRPIG